jgi:hypothetical protein
VAHGFLAVDLRALLRHLLLDLQSLDPQQIVLEDARGAGGVTHLVTAMGIRNLDRLVAPGQRHQDVADSVNRLADGQ